MNAISVLFKKKNQSVLKVPWVWSHVVKWISGRERPAPLGLLWESGFMASINVCVVQVCRKGKRGPSRADRKREGWNNYVSAQRLFDLLKVQEKGVSPLWLPVHPVLHTLKTQHTLGFYFSLLISCVSFNFENPDLVFSSSIDQIRLFWTQGDCKVMW